MSQRWVGIIAHSEHLLIVAMDLSEHIPQILLSEKWHLQPQGTTGKGKKKEKKLRKDKVYQQMFQRLKNYFIEYHIDTLVIRAGRTTRFQRGVIPTAELRGVTILAGAEANIEVILPDKQSVDNTFGNRKVDQYVSDDGWWDQRVLGSIQDYNRETAIFILSEAGKRQ